MPHACSHLSTGGVVVVHRDEADFEREVFIVTVLGQEVGNDSNVGIVEPATPLARLQGSQLRQRHQAFADLPDLPLVGCGEPPRRSFPPGF